MRWHLKTNWFGLMVVMALLPAALTPAFGQICTNRSFSSENLEEDSPTQRVGTARSDRAIQWSRPADFTDLLHFSGKAYQLAEHEGIDFINSNQSVAQVSVRSAANGEVVYIRRSCPQFHLFEPNTEKRGCGGDWGNHIVILHPNGLFTRYAHLFPDSIKVKVGQQVLRGEEIAKMGNSGKSDIRHLHFELGVAISFKPCEPSQSFKYVYNPAIYLGWDDLLP
jgi:murein DD-endopeptidase MepM/ murein hydrolase activator NlpD